MRVCVACKTELSEARLAAAPEEQLCVACLTAAGDVELTTGYMSWEHKTAPMIVIGEDAKKLRRYDRKGFHAQLPLNSKNNPRMLASLGTVNLSLKIRPALPPEDTNFEPVKLPVANCHPDRPRATPSGHCVECALDWYRRRAR